MAHENRISSYVSPTEGKGRDDLDQSVPAVFEVLRPKAERMLEAIKKQLVEHPGTAVAIGISVGVVLGCLVKRR